MTAEVATINRIVDNDDRVDFGTLDFGRQRDDARIGRMAGNRAQIIAATGGARDLNLPRLRQNFSLARNASGVISGARRGGQRKKKTRRAPNSSRPNGIFTFCKLENSKNVFERADSVNRTRDLLITNQLLYLLSYVG